MRHLRRYLTAALTALMLVLVLASPSAAAWSIKTNYGSPGEVKVEDSVAVEGGICYNDNPMLWTCTTEHPPGVLPKYNQIFVGNYTASAAQYPVAQRITSTAYLYRYDSSTKQWKQYRTYNEGSCEQVVACKFGNSAPDVGDGPWAPAFIDLPPGNFWTVAIRVNWYDYSTGRSLASASYYPGSTTADIGCAGFAKAQHRCSGPWAGSRHNLGAPTPTVGYIKMP